MKKLHRKTSTINLLDEAEQCCRNIATLADLLAYSDSGTLHPATIANTGELLSVESQKLLDLLMQLTGRLSKP